MQKRNQHKIDINSAVFNFLMFFVFIRRFSTLMLRRKTLKAVLSPFRFLFGFILAERLKFSAFISGWMLLDFVYFGFRAYILF